jgi:chorismate lyase
MNNMTFFHPTFPIELIGQWYPEPTDALHPNLLDWLYDPSSLTARLKSHCHEFHVQLLGQTSTICQAEEAMAEILAGEPVLAREVVLYCDNQPQVFARSLLPLSSLTGAEQQLADLGTTPLGQVLFNNPLLRRARIEVARFEHDSTVAQFAHQLQLTAEHALWGRRSLFTLNNKPLLVAEVFLPGALAYRQHRN